MDGLSDQEESFLEISVRDGNAVLFLGAGASAGCVAKNGEPIKSGWGLAKDFAERAGLPFNDEALPEVIDAIVGRIFSQSQIDAMLQAEYTKVTASSELERLLNFTWKRIYTWNIDDALHNMRGGVQIRQQYNGMCDKASPVSDPAYLQIVQLHGDARKPEHRFIFSTSEYSRRLNRNDHEWYRAAGNDYSSSVPVFIGSKLAEPILDAELERARPHPDSGLGMAYLIIPIRLTPIKQAQFRAKNIIPIQASLEDFVVWLETRFNGGYTPDQLAAGKSNFFASALAAGVVGSRDIVTANSIKVIEWKTVKADVTSIPNDALPAVARNFLEGEPANWALAASDVPVELNQLNDLYDGLCRAVEGNSRSFLVYGQAGSGKSTALRQVVLRYLKEEKVSRVFQLNPETPSLRNALELILRLSSDGISIVYCDDLFIFGDSLDEDLSRHEAGKILFVSTARTAEWKGRFKRRLRGNYTAFEFQRFERADFDPLIDRLLRYVPSPTFKKMTRGDQRARLESSDKQLLIAMKEATGSKKFSSVISDEYVNLKSSDAQALCVLIGIGTLARTGLTEDLVREAYARVASERKFDEALEELSGIVRISEGGRFFARHEIYSRHIIENVADLEFVIECVIACLEYFTKFEVPIIKVTPRLETLLFKFMLNHNFIVDLCQRRNLSEFSTRIYEPFELEFQLDGHYWLQYGQAYVRLSELEPALRVLSKSIEAYPENSFAIHALADVQLRVAAQRATYDAETIDLIASAVGSLEEQNAKSDSQSDQYPLVTLSDRHIAALLKHGRIQEAEDCARRYFRELQELSKNFRDDYVDASRQRLAHFLSTGDWYDGQLPLFGAV